VATIDPDDVGAVAGAALTSSGRPRRGRGRRDGHVPARRGGQRGFARPRALVRFSAELLTGGSGTRGAGRVPFLARPPRSVSNSSTRTSRAARSSSRSRRPRTSRIRGGMCSARPRPRCCTTPSDPRCSRHSTPTNVTDVMPKS
jgi:hypothetical protein